MAFLDSSGVTRLWQHIIAKLGNKVDKETGKGLSTNDYTTTEKDKLAGIAEGANNYTLPVASSTLGGVKTTNTAELDLLTAQGYEPIPIVDGIPYYIPIAVSENSRFPVLTVGNLGLNLPISKSAGSEIKPVYFLNGYPYETTYTLEASVPANAKFTDTTYTAGNSGIAISAQKIYNKGILSLSQGTTNGTIKYSFFNQQVNNVVTSDLKIKGLDTAAYHPESYFVPATRTINNKALSANISLTASDVGAASSTLVLGQMKTFTIAGDKDHYYPVVFNVHSEYFLNRIAITRYYNDIAPDDWGTDANHKGGLTFQFQWNGDSFWGGNGTSNSLKVETLIENYCKMVGGMKLSTSGVVVWLRGGSALYKVLNEMGSAMSITPYYDTFTDDAGNSFPVRTYDASVVDSEIQQRLVFYPLTGGNLLGNLYASGEICSKRNNYPEVYFKNATGTTLADFYVDTTSGGFADTVLKVFSDASTAKYFVFGKDGTFTAPSTVYSSLFAVQSDNFPQLTLQNNKAANLALLYVNTTTGDYSSVYLRVYASASAYSTFNFGNDGKLSCGSLALATALPISSGGTGATTASGALTNLGALPLTGGTLTGNLGVNGIITAKTYLAVERNSNPQLALKNANSNPLAVLYTETSNGSYGNTHLQVYKSATESTTFIFSNQGSFRATMLQVDGSNDWPSLYFKCSSKANPGVLLQASATHGFGIYCYGTDLDSASTRYYEGYRFPDPATGLTENKNYTVYSEKNIIYSSSQPTGVKGAIWLKPV